MEYGLRNTAVKATPNPFILNILKEEGCMWIVLLTELMMAEAGFYGDETMFSSNGIQQKSLYGTKAHATINLDDFTHIEYLEKVAGLPKIISCRYNLVVFTTTNGIMDNPGDASMVYKEQ